MSDETDRSTATDDASPSVVYVDTDASAARSVADCLSDRLDGDTIVHSTGEDEARGVVAAEDWSCLVLAGAVEQSVQDDLLDAVDCPVILFTRTDPSTVSTAKLDRVETLVERGNGDRSVGFLAEKLKTLLRSRPDTAEDTLATAISAVETQASDATALFAVDETGRVVWSTRSFEAAFPVDDIEGAVPDTDDFYARLDAIHPATPDEHVPVELGDGTDLLDGQSLVVPAADQSRFYVHDTHDLSAVDGGLTLERFEDVTERVHREARTALLERLVEHAQDGLYTLDHNGVIDFCNESFAANLGYDREELLGEHAAVTLAPGELETGQETVQYLLDNPDEDSTEVDMTFLTRSGEPREMSIHYTLLPTEDGTYGGLMGVIRDVTERHRRERRIERQRDELAALNRTNELVQEIIGAIGDAADREELQGIVCDRLIESGRYELAWIGERRGASDVIVPLTSAGDATGYLDGIEIRTDGDPTGQGPGGRACRTGEVQVVIDVRDDERFAPWRDDAIEAGLQSLIAVPLEHGQTTHGILAVYATEPDAFSDRVTESFGVLGETIGLALTAIQNKRLLHRDATVSLTFRSPSEDACLVWLARACDCTLETAGAVETSDGVVQYLRVDGATPSAVVEAIRERRGDVDAAVTRTEGDQIVEIHTESSLAVALSEAGARLQTATARPDGVRIVVHASADADIRAIQDVVERSNPQTELVSKTERTSPSSEAGGAAPLDSLTDRQHEVLRAAYLAGYYDWPRESTAEELAGSVGIASSTLHQHLRRAERNLLGTLLDT